MSWEDNNQHQTSQTPNSMQADAHVLTKWTRVQDRLRADLGDNIWRSWIKGLDIYGLEQGTVMLGSGSSFVTARVNSQYADRLRMYWQAEDASCP
jgi:chromosomal replication initiator protein